jgi:hypothetical protein
VSISREIYSLRRQVTQLQETLDDLDPQEQQKSREKLVTVYRAFLRHTSNYLNQLPFVVQAGSEHKLLLSEMSNLLFLMSLTAARLGASSGRTGDVIDAIKSISDLLFESPKVRELSLDVTSWRNLNDGTSLHLENWDYRKEKRNPKADTKRMSKTVCFNHPKSSVIINRPKSAWAVNRNSNDENWMQSGYPGGYSTRTVNSSIRQRPVISSPDILRHHTRGQSKLVAYF